MERLRGAGCTIGKCVGDGQRESVSVDSKGGPLDAGLGLKIILLIFYMTAKQ